jgi:hypothetical protein
MDKSSREYMLWCEARMVCDKTRLADRQEYLRNIEKRRGKKAADELKAKVREIWEKRSQQEAGSKIQG